MNIYNSFTRKKEVFKNIVAGKVSMYVCGPTVYDNAHLGHGRSAVAFDLIRRYFLYKGFEVNYVSNFTDIDDKMISRANEEGISVKELADRIIPIYHSDYDALNVLRPTIQPLATEYILQMIDIIESLEKKGCTYLLDDGVYFDVNTFRNYGCLSGNNLDDLQAGARKCVNSKKRNHQDFVLWKFKKPGEPFWESPWGEGRPGWHIECSAMTMACLGESFDIHGGGLDLTFPHHECEIAQSQSCFGDNSFAKYWMHNGFINVDDVKMSKSLGNFFTLQDVFKKYDPVVVRFMFLQTHYRNPVNFSDQLLEQAKSALNRIFTAVKKLQSAKGNSGEFSKSFVEFTNHTRQKFTSAMDEDFDSSGALAAIFDFIKFTNSTDLSPVEARESLELLQELDQVLAVIFFDSDSELPTEILELVKQREAARSSKDFEKSDQLRDQIFAAGFVVEDTEQGSVVKAR